MQNAPTVPVRKIIALIVVCTLAIFEYRHETVGLADSPASEKISPTETKDIDKASSDRKTASSNKDSSPSAPIEYSGIVTDTEGKPLADATLYLQSESAPFKSIQQAKTNANGEFRFQLDHQQTNNGAVETRGPWRIVATADGYGPEFWPAKTLASRGNLVLKLPLDDLAIEGRVLTLEGTPVPGVEIGVGKIKPIGTQSRRVVTSINAFLQGDELWLPVAPKIVSDNDGRFQIRGIGRERQVELEFFHPTIENPIVDVMTIPGQAQRIPAVGFVVGRPLFRIRYGATFVHVAAPSYPVVGVVRDVETGEPLAGVPVGESTVPPGQSTALAKTDDLGRFELTGLSIGPHEILASPEAVLPYFGRSDSCNTAEPGQRRGASLEIKVRKGILMTGRIVDLNDKPIPVSVSYFPLSANPYLAEYAQFVTVATIGAQRVIQYPVVFSKADGSFQIPVLPGPGLLLVRLVQNGPKLGPSPLRIRLEDRDKDLATEKNPVFFATSPRPQSLREYHAYQFVQPEPNGKSQHFELTVEQGNEIQGQVVDSEGKPLPDVVVHGISQYPHRLLSDGMFTAAGMTRRYPRLLCFYQKEGHVGAAHRTTGEEQTAVIKLEPCGTIGGRIIDDAGKPVANAKLELLYADEDDQPRIAFPRDRSDTTDGEGRFTLSDLIPGLKFRLAVATEPGARPVSVAEATVGAGRSVDLGTAKIDRQSGSSRLD